MQGVSKVPHAGLIFGKQSGSQPEGRSTRHQDAITRNFKKGQPPTSPARQRALNWHEPRPPLTSSVVDFARSTSHSHSLCHPPPARRGKFYDSQPFWLALYFCFNLGLTLYNKGVLVRFPFPYTLTAIHALCGSFGGYVLLRSDVFVPARLNSRETAILVAFSVLYAVNIAVSNVSLEIVTVPFHQVVRATTPIFTVMLSASILGIHSSQAKIMALVPVIAGVGLATYGDYQFTHWGFLLTILGAFLAAQKTIVTNVLQSPSLISTKRLLPFSPPRLRLHPLDLLTRMSPLAFIQCVLLAQLTGELDRVRQYSAREMTLFKALALVVNGAIAFGLNVVSFTANKKAGALSMTVAANVKQVLTIMSAVAIFDLTITWVNAIGILLTLFGGAWYARVEYQENKEPKRKG